MSSNATARTSTCPAIRPNCPLWPQSWTPCPDPRNPRGRRYRLGPLLTLSLLAALSGATSLAKITRFIIGCDPQVRVRLGLPTAIQLAASTVGRLLARLDGDALDHAIGTYLAHLTADPHSSPPHTSPLHNTSRVSRPALVGLAVDGKTLRGSRTSDTEVHQMAAVRHADQIAIAQRQIAARSNEIPAFTCLLSSLY